MVIVWGSIEALDGRIDDVLKLSREHVSRSREEPGCVSHSVQIDADNENRLIFFEEWESMAALHVHFRVPESVQFAEAMGRLAVAPPEIRLYEATRLQ